jgi:hypothetical protein
MDNVDIIPVIAHIPLKSSQLKLKQIVAHGDSITHYHDVYHLELQLKISVQVDLIDVEHKDKEVNGMDQSEKNVEVK